MKIKNTIFSVIALSLILMSFGCTKQYVQISELETFKQTGPSNITKIEILELTEGGDQKKSVSDAATIQKIFNKFYNMKILGESNLACDDNTINYKFYYSDGHMFDATIEDKTLIINKERYLIE